MQKQMDGPPNVGTRPLSNGTSGRVFLGESNRAWNMPVPNPVNSNGDRCCPARIGLRDFLPNGRFMAYKWGVTT